MLTISNDYVDQLPQIYKDILRSFFMFNPQQRPGQRVAVQSLYSALRDKKYTLAQIRVACENMRNHGVVSMSDEIFVAPTPQGKALIERLEQPDPAEVSVAAFPPLGVEHEGA